MYKQANFATAWFPEATTVGPDGDVDFFVLPGVSRTEPAPLLRGGDGAIQFSDRSEVSQLMTYLVSPEGGRAWAEQGGYFSIRDSVPIDEYGQTDQLFAEVLREGRVDRFDASDSFPSDLRDTLLDAITRYVEETSFLDNAPNLDNLVDAVDAVDARRAEE
jgi:alpha-glucoside transport system substrate-binding protein